MGKEPKDILQGELRRRGLSATELARAFGFNEVTFRSHVNGTRKPNRETAALYAATLGLNRNELLDLDVRDGVTVDLPKDRAELGKWIDVEFEGTIKPQLGAVRGVPKALGQDTRRAVEVLDDSVNNRIKAGDFAVYQPVTPEEAEEIEDGYVYVSRRRGQLEERTIRKVAKRVNGKLTLITDSSDTRYSSTITYPSSCPDEVVRIIGRVTHWFGAL